jgi:hypothetical protein
MIGEESFVGPNQHIENRVADAENIVFCVSHPFKALPAPSPPSRPITGKAAIEAQ